MNSHEPAELSDIAQLSRGNRMVRKSIVVGLACIAFSSAALAQGGGGAGGGAGGASSGGGTSSVNSGAPAQSGTQAGQDKTGASTTTSGNNNRSNSAEQRRPNGAMTPAQRAQTGLDTRPQSESPGAVSSPGVGVGHSANGLPIGSPGSGPGSPEEPLDAKKR